MGEGGAVLVVEEASRAIARGARVYAEVLGYGTNGDGYDIVQPRPDGSGAARCLSLALARRTVPPTANLTEPDPECDLDYVPGKARVGDLRVAVSVSLGFGGHNATVVLGQWKEGDGCDQ